MDKAGKTTGDGRATLSGTASCTGGGKALLRFRMGVGNTPYMAYPDSGIPCDGKAYKWTATAVLDPHGGPDQQHKVQPGESGTVSGDLYRDNEFVASVEGITVNFTEDTSNGKVTVDKTGKTKGDGTATLTGTASCDGGGTRRVELWVTISGSSYTGSPQSEIACDGQVYKWTGTIEPQTDQDTHKIQPGESGVAEGTLSLDGRSVFAVGYVPVTFEKG